MFCAIVSLCLSKEMLCHVPSNFLLTKIRIKCIFQAREAGRVEGKGQNRSKRNKIVEFREGKGVLCSKPMLTTVISLFQEAEYFIYNRGQ